MIHKLHILKALPLPPSLLYNLWHFRHFLLATHITQLWPLNRREEEDVIVGPLSDRANMTSSPATHFQLSLWAGGGGAGPHWHTRRLERRTGTCWR